MEIIFFMGALLFTGLLGGLSKYQTLTVTAPGPAGPPLLETLNWQGIDTLRVTTIEGTPNRAFPGGSGPYLAIDDFTYDANAAPVPESSSLLLFGIGFAGLITFKRKFRKSWIRLED